ncbi:MAG: 30S ribosomal protein S8e [Candidatus Pacearchaeota archaeon]
MKTGRKITGGKYHHYRKKRKSERSRNIRLVKLGEPKKKKIRMYGGKYKTVLLSSNVINVIVGKKCKKVKIKNVLETPNNKFLARQNLMTKGTIVETELGKVKITNRPGQEGQINGILIEKQK